MEKGLVTIVVPIYNTEKYLDRCISSIVNQTYRNLEILLIDDDSTDSCPRMCDAWAEKDSRIRVFHKENEGQGLSRNVGIAHATGEYIYFIDSDDYIHPETIEKAYSCAAQNQAEVVIFGFSAVDAAGRTHSPFTPQGKRVYRGAEVQEEFLPELIAPDPKGDGIKKFYMAIWTMLISVESIRKYDWKFVSERIIISEDVYSLLTLFSKISSVAVLSEALYRYCVNSESFSRKRLPGRYHKIRHFYKETMNLCDRLGYDSKIKQRLSEPYISYTIAAMKQEIASNISVAEKYKTVREIIYDPMLHDVMEQGKGDSSNWKKKFFFWAIRKKMTGLCCLLIWVQNVLQK